MSEIADLLEKLKQLDEPTYKYYFEGMIARGSGFTAKMVMTKVQEAWLQFCIQRACESKSWFWQVAHGECLGYMATVDGETRYTNCGSSACQALLSAYISCLESHP